MVDIGRLLRPVSWHPYLVCSLSFERTRLKKHPVVGLLPCVQRSSFLDRQSPELSLVNRELSQAHPALAVGS